MTYAQFKEFIARFLWKASDAELIADLDNLCQMALARLRVDLNISEREVAVEYEPATNSVAFDDLLSTVSGMIGDEVVSLRDIAIDEIGPVKYMPPAQFYEQRRLATSYEPYCTIVGKTLMLIGPFAADTAAGSPKKVYVTVVAEFPDFVNDVVVNNPLTRQYLDLFTYGTLVHAAGFLREDERLPQWKQLYDDGIARTVDHNAMFGKRVPMAPMLTPYQQSTRK
jgi:hypothetical protein